MKHKLIPSFLFTAAFLALASAAMASTTWYVNGVSGSNSNNCKSPTTACKTIKHAISLASSGDSIIVAAATYTENLTISVNLTIVGSGSSTTIIDGGGVSRVVTISSATAHVSLSRMTIRNGHAVYGGGIRNSGTLTLSKSTVTGNVGGDGGGLWNGGTLTINNSSVSGNGVHASCNEGCGVFGGGIYNSAGALTISNSTVMGNGASIFLCSPSGGCAAGGAGILNGGRLRINKSTVSGNFASAPFSISRPSHSAGGGIINVGTAIIGDSTISGNTAILGAAAIGSGGGIYNSGGTVIVSNSTLAGNSARVGGVDNYSGSTTLQNSIVANNSGGNCYGVKSNGYNLSSDTTCAFSNTGDLNNTNPLLGPLQNNGGPTQTMALPSGSPAIDAGNPNGCSDGLGHLLKTDQRGKPRPDTEDTGGCDIGAFERQSD